MFAKILTSVAALSLVATPVAAQEAAAERQAAIIEQSEALEGQSGGLLALFAVVAIILGVAILTADDEDDEPASP